MLTPEALARVQRRMDSCGAHKKFSEHCSDCAHVRALEAALAALTPAPTQGEHVAGLLIPGSGKAATPGGEVPASSLTPLAATTPLPPEPEGEPKKRLRIARGMYPKTPKAVVSLQRGYLWIGGEDGPFRVAISGRTTLLRIAAMIRRYAR